MIRCDGDLSPTQWMTVGRGIVHAEMPNSDGNNIRLKLWVDQSQGQGQGQGGVYRMCLDVCYTHLYF